MRITEFKIEYVDFIPPVEAMKEGVLHFDEDFPSRFFDHYRQTSEIPSPQALLDISTSINLNTL